MSKQTLLIVLGCLLAAGAGTPALGQNGFYGGVSMRDNGTESTGLLLGDVQLAWNRFAAPVADDTQPRSLMFGGYRWKNDVAVEAAVNTDRQVRIATRRRAAGHRARAGPRAL